MKRIIIIVVSILIFIDNNTKAQIQYVVNTPNKSGNLAGSSGSPFFINLQNHWENTANGHSTIQYNKDYQFNIPANAIIFGIQVNCDVIITNLVDSSVYLQKNNIKVGSDRAFHLPIISAPAISWGGNTDLWGTTWTPNEINDSTFGVQFRVKEINGSNPFSWEDANDVEIGVYYEIPTSTNNIEKNNLFKIFPNPAKNNIEITFKNIENNFQFELYDILGNLLQSKFITENTNKINLHNYPKGIYLAKVFNNHSCPTKV